MADKNISTFDGIGFQNYVNYLMSFIMIYSIIDYKKRHMETCMDGLPGSWNQSPLRHSGKETKHNIIMFIPFLDLQLNIQLPFLL